MSITVVRYDVWPVGGDSASDARNVTVPAVLTVPDICTTPMRYSGLFKTKRFASVIESAGRMSPISIMHDNTEGIDNMSVAVADQDVLTSPN